MKTKRAWFIYKAIKDGNVVMKDIVNYVKNNMDMYVSDVYLRYIANCLEIKGYIKSKKVGRGNEWYIIKEVNNQVEIKL